MPIYKEEFDFLSNVRRLLIHGVIYDKQFSPDFKGLSEEGQKYLANLLCKKAIQYLLEKGAAIPATAWYKEQRVDNYSLLNYPIRLSFSSSLFHGLWHLFDKSHPLPEKPQFTGADNIILLTLMELCFLHERYLDRENFWMHIASHAFLPRFFYIMHWKGGDEKENWSSFFADPVSHAILFALRHCLRDNFVHQFNNFLRNKTFPDMVEYGVRLHKFIAALFDHCKNGKHIELVAPFCECYQIIFCKCPHIEIIERKNILGCQYDSDRRKHLMQLLSCYDWVKQLDMFHKRAVQSRRWDDDYEYFNIVKKYYGVIDDKARDNARQTMEYLENVV